MSVLISAHSYLRYFLLAFLLVNVATTLYGIVSKRQYTNSDDKLSLALFICTHLQLTLGIILYFMWTSQANVFSDMKATMHDGVLRYYTVEHLVGMLAAIVLISLGRIIAKKQTTSEAKFRRAFTFFAFGLAVITAMLLHMPR